ncbi:MAG TPA: hypothetical protein PK591_11325 [Ignavibacteriales bacterium]|nr:hypothetical protein [Ignavibacteriales bacterium]
MNKYFIKNISYSILVQIIYLGISIFNVIVVPKFLDIQSYGFWQLYLFYIGFAGFFHLGLIDGIYLKYGGSDYNMIKKNIVRMQFWSLVLIEVIFSCIIYFILFNIKLSLNSDKYIILLFSIFNITIITIQTFFLFILQSTNRIKEYSFFSILNKFIYFIFITIIIFLKFNNYIYFIFIDIISKIITITILMLKYKDLIIGPFSTFKFFLIETKNDLLSGNKLMLSNITGILILGVIRFFIEQYWDIETFGKISFSLNISQVLLLFVSAISIVLFPLLKKLNEKRLRELYENINILLMFIFITTLISYFPIRYILGIWLPSFNDKLNYLVILFPIVLYESKMSLLGNSYLKSLRKEGKMLKFNFISFLLSTFLCILFIVYFKDLNLAVASILFVFAFRSIITELYLSQLFKIKILHNIMIELFITIAFIATGWLFSLLLGAIIFIILYLLLTFIFRKQIMHSFSFFKNH